MQITDQTHVRDERSCKILASRLLRPEPRASQTQDGERGPSPAATSLELGGVPNPSQTHKLIKFRPQNENLGKGKTSAQEASSTTPITLSASIQRSGTCLRCPGGTQVCVTRPNGHHPMAIHQVYAGTVPTNKGPENSSLLDSFAYNNKERAL